MFSIFEHFFSRQGSLFLFNTKTRKKELFVPLKKGKMAMYSCGPTVYHFAHIGNFRSFVFSDTVRRVGEYAGYRVKQIINVTDFGHLAGDADDTEDKMLIGLKREGKEPTMENMLALATKYLEAFKVDMQRMNIRPPAALPRASDHVRGMIAYVETLLEKGYAYRLSDGIYFDTSKFPHYGCLGGSASEDHSRVGLKKEKKNQKDFALWKFNSEMGWDAPWGKGFPGWHIECTAMSTQYLGKTFDIHTGGVDHISIHHNNEIAQAECANNKPYARVWLHNEFILIDGKRIGKSEGNMITLSQLIDRGIHPLAYRYWLLTGHYRQQMNFTWEAVRAAETALLRARKMCADMKKSSSFFARPDIASLRAFEKEIYDDYNTPGAIAVLWQVLKHTTLDDQTKRATVKKMDEVLGVGLCDSFAPPTSLPVKKADEEEACALLREREEAREKKDFDTADRLRKNIEEKGFQVIDEKEGARLVPKEG